MDKALQFKGLFRTGNEEEKEPRKLLRFFDWYSLKNVNFLIDLEVSEPQTEM